MNWVLVQSKMLAAVAYNRDWQQLYLKFHSGEIYCYRAFLLSSIKSCWPPIPKESTFAAAFRIATRTSEFILQL